MTRWIEDELREIDARAERRRLESWAAPGPYLVRDGQRLLNLAGNDYLGLTAHPEVRRAAAQAALDLGTGATASRLLAGTTAIHETFEDLLCQWRGHPAALSFSSGYMVALGAIPLLAGRGDLILADRLCHACLLDAARLSGAQLLRFRHNDVEDLKSRLAKRDVFRRCLIVTESIFSMDGDVAPIDEILRLAQQHEATLFVDEAHAVGVAGPRGAGLTAGRSEAADWLISMGACGKALASSGGFITCSSPFRELMINRARTFLFDTAPAPATIAAAEEAIRQIQAHPEWISALQQKANRVRDRLREAGLDVLQSSTQIIPVLLGDNERVVRVAQALRNQGVLVAAIRPPTVPPGSARLRLSISLAHRDEDLDRAAGAIIGECRA